MRGTTVLHSEGLDRSSDPDADGGCGLLVLPLERCVPRDRRRHAVASTAKLGTKFVQALPRESHGPTDLLGEALEIHTHDRDYRGRDLRIDGERIGILDGLVHMPEPHGDTLDDSVQPTERDAITGPCPAHFGDPSRGLRERTCRLP